MIIGTGSCIPTRAVLNEDFLGQPFFETYGKPFAPEAVPRLVAKLKEITDIAERRYVTDDLVASDLAFQAGAKALASADIDPETLDYVIVAHNFGDILADNLRTDLVPSLAARVKASLKIANPDCICYDLAFGCPGWLQAVIQANYFLRSGEAKRALVIGAETLSRISDPYDRDSMIYADGAGAVVLEGQYSSQRVGILAHAVRSDTLEHARLLWMGPSFNPDAGDHKLCLKMEGRKLYEYALTTVPGVVRQSLEKAGLGLEDVNKVLLHQANGKMDDAILKRLFRLYGMQEIPAGIMPMTISWLGNSSVATLPTLLDLIQRGQLPDQALTSGATAVFASVGAGMNINSVVYRCP
ncbi:MAG: ketoacyl-ACP synthase III [Holophaga sp.]|nr:ketoacyl-ACP synthase III [Holophaga sp.]